LGDANIGLPQPMNDVRLGNVLGFPGALPSLSQQIQRGRL